MTSPEKIVAQFLKTRKFNKKAYENGWVTEEEFFKLQRDSLMEFSEWLCAGDQNEMAFAGITLLAREANQNRLEGLIKENMYQAVTYN